MLPESGTVIDDVTAALQDFLEMIKIKAQAGHTQYGGLGNANWRHMFSVSGAQIKIRNVQFQGAQEMDAALLAREAMPLVGRDYSSSLCDIFGVQTFVPVYREHGYLRVAIGQPKARVVGQTAEAGPFGVEVSYPVTEGLAYKWSSVQWSGNQVLKATELDALMGMTMGVVANGKMIDAGWEQGQQGYGKKGYIDVRVRTQPSYDDTNRTVSFQSTITEGPQYHMGVLTLNGVPAAVAQEAQSKWKLKTGTVYDASYFREYITKDLPSTVRATSVQTEIRPNREQLTVDVVLTMK
jgi:outer membrane protein assembly factor BamA